MIYILLREPLPVVHHQVQRSEMDILEDVQKSGKEPDGRFFFESSMGLIQASVQTSQLFSQSADADMTTNGDCRVYEVQ